MCLVRLCINSAFVSDSHFVWCVVCLVTSGSENKRIGVFTRVFVCTATTQRESLMTAFVCEVFLSPSHVDAVRADTFCALFGILSWRSRCADGCLFDKRRALIATWQMQKKKMCRKVQTLCRESYISSAARSKRWVVEDGASSTDSSCFYSSDGWSAHIAGTETESMNNNKK